MKTRINYTLDKITQQKPNFTIFAGFDGFVDTIVRPVKSRQGSQTEYFSTIEEFGNYLVTKSGKSCALALDIQEQRLGGNTPIFSRAAAKLGAQVICAASVGWPRQSSIFTSLSESCQLSTVGAPGLCTALEFSDGKVMMMQNTEIDELNYATIEMRVGRDALKEKLQKADMLALLNWSELPCCTDIWKGILDVCMEIPQEGKRKKLIFDLADCSPRTRSEIIEMVKLLQQFAIRHEVMLSLNNNEAEVLGKHLGITVTEPQKLAQALYDVLGLDVIVIHTRACACAQNMRGSVTVPTQTVTQPVTSTGGGDHFNAALAFGWGADLTLEEQLVLANALSAGYVATGQSLTVEQLQKFYSEEA